MTHNTFEVNTPITTTDDEILQVNGEAHYIRFEVLALLEQSRGLVNYFAVTEDVNRQITRIDDCINTITTHRIAHEHSLWEILLEELNNCKHTLQNRRNMNPDTPNIMTQHAGYLGRMRGLPAALSQMPNIQNNHTDQETCGDPDAMTPVPLGRTFSNYAQRQISSQLTATVSRSQAPPTSSVHSGTQTPGSSTTSPALRPMNNGLHILPIPEVSSFPESLPFPTGPLTRQVACCTPISRASSTD
jgi:hypothetical protein